jgi:hydrogenase-4 component F
VLIFGLLLSFGALLLRVTEVSFGEVKGPAGPVRASYLPVIAHLSLVLAAGIWLPPALARWFQHVAALLG